MRGGEVDRLVITGGNPVSGTMNVYGAKNSILPIMAAAVINQTSDEIILRNVPEFTDYTVMSDILEALGARVKRLHDTVIIRTDNINNYAVPGHLMSQMRSGIFLMGPLLTRQGRVRVSAPGGCAIGSRPFELHLKGLAAMGVRISEERGYIEAVGKPLSARIHLDYPSVGATENLMMAAAGAAGATVISNPAREPEIVDLQSFLNTIGAKVTGAGTGYIRVEGVDSFCGGEYRVIPDRIVTGTYMIAAAITGGDVLLKDVIPVHLEAVTAKLRECGVEIITGEDWIRVRHTGQLKALDILRTQNYPGFATDLQPPLLALLTLAEGTSVVVENVFENRYRHVAELVKMGANITVQGRTAIVRGVDNLRGTEVEATDLRAGAALVLAGLAAKGTTVVRGVEFINRGYQDISAELSSLHGVIYNTGQKDTYDNSSII